MTIGFWKVFNRVNKVNLGHKPAREIRMVSAWRAGDKGNETKRCPRCPLFSHSGEAADCTIFLTDVAHSIKVVTFLGHAGRN